MGRLRRVALAASLCLSVTSAAFAQARSDGRLIITVVDQSNGVLPGAAVTVSGADDATRVVALAPVITETNGLATINGLTPGRYDVLITFDGFAPGRLKDVRVRAGDNRQTVTLAIERREDVTVAQDAQQGASDRKSGVFGTALTREQMQALSDDPNEMQRQLQEMAGPGATIRVDSFEGAALPPKAQIKAIHITRDQFAAENHSADGLFVDIITQPGVGSIRTNVNYQAHTTGMTSRNALAANKGADQVQNFGVNFSGGLIKNKASFSLGMRGFSSYDTPVLTAVQPDGSKLETLTKRAPRNQRFVNGSFDYAVTLDQTLRLAYNQSDFTNENLGIGAFNQVDRAYDSENHTHSFRVQEAGPVGRRFFTNTRLNAGWTDTKSTSAVEAVTVRVIDAFTTGGAQVAGGRHSRDLNFASDLDYVRGIQSWRAGVAVDGNWFRSNDTSNYLGTYTFENLDAYNAGTPRSFVKRIGDPNLSFTNVQFAAYVQDDIRVRRSLTLTGGLRYEAQTHVGGTGNIAPRLGTTWAPFKNGKTTLRASWGRFFDWLSTSTYEQTLRVDGFRQQEQQVLNPTFPVPVLDATTVTPVNRYLLSDGLQQPMTTRVSGGVDYGFTQRLHAIAMYRYSRGSRLLRGENLNAPIDGVRPDPRFGNVIAVASDARGRQHQIQFFAQTPPPPPSFGGGPLWDFKRWGFFSGYTLLFDRNNTDGAFNTPATGSLDDDWADSSNASRHRVQAGFTSSALRGLTWQIDGQFSSGTPYTIRTGFDDNGDLIFNDRPAGIGRNTLIGTDQWTMNLFATYNWSFGRRLTPSGGPMIYGTPAGVSVANVAPPAQGRYRLGLSINIQNLTNRANLTGYSGVVTSKYYGLPTLALSPRRVNVGLQLGF